MEVVPDVLLRPGALGLLRWQWLAIPLLIATAIAIALLFGRGALLVAQRLASRTRSEWDDIVVERLSGPATAAVALATMSMLVPWLDLAGKPYDFAWRTIRAGFFLVFFWSLWRLVDVVRQVLLRSRWAMTSASSSALLPIGARVTKVLLVAISVVAVLSMLGYPVASLIAGLGLGGLAFALAAQKTLENLFGTFSIGVDQPFREGDVVRIEDFIGTVERIGLRSTRFRTPDRTLISLPNGRLADMRVESLTARDRFRLAMVLGLVYQSNAEQVRQVLAGVRSVLAQHPKIWPDEIIVALQELGASAVSIEIMAWFAVNDFAEFRAARQDVLLQFMDVVAAAGTSLAYPTQTVHLIPPAAQPREPRSGP